MLIRKVLVGQETQVEKLLVRIKTATRLDKDIWWTLNTSNDHITFAIFFCFNVFIIQFSMSKT